MSHLIFSALLIQVTDHDLSGRESGTGPKNAHSAIGIPRTEGMSCVIIWEACWPTKFCNKIKLCSQNADWKCAPHPVVVKDSISGRYGYTNGANWQTSDVTPQTSWGLRIPSLWEIWGCKVKPVFLKADRIHGLFQFLKSGYLHGSKFIGFPFIQFGRSPFSFVCKRLGVKFLYAD